MSFSVELWNGYDVIYSHFSNRRKGLKDFVFMLNSKYDSDLEYSKSLKKIYEYNFIVTSEGTLSHGIQAFKNDLLNQFNYTVEFVNSLKEEIIEPLKKFYNDQMNIGKKLNDDMRKVERDFKEGIDRVDKSKLRYHSCAKIAEESKLQYELSKLNQIMNSEHRSRLSNKAQNALKEAKEAEKAYILCLNYANNTRDLFIDATKRILTNFQTLEEKYVDFTKDSLRKYTIYQIALVRNLQYDIEKKAKTMESIDSKADIRDFIEKNATKGLPPYKFEFIPYISEIFTKNNENNIPTPIITNVKNFIQNTFLTEPPEIEPDPIEGKSNAEIKNLVNNAWEGKSISEEETKIFLKHVKEKKYRKFFLSSLNKFRISGLFNLDEKSFSSLGSLMFDCLEDIYKEKDFDSTRFCMLLSQTFYKTATEPNKPRIFLQTAIEVHDIWKNVDYWEELIRYSINEEMLNQQNYNIYSFENPTEKQRRIQNLVYSQLISFIYNMLSFDISKGRAKEIIEKFADYFQLNEENVNNLRKNIDEYMNNSESTSKSDKDEFFTSKQKNNDDIDTNIIKNIINQTLKPQITKSKEKIEKNSGENSNNLLNETIPEKKNSLFLKGEFISNTNDNKLNDVEVGQNLKLSKTSSTLSKETLEKIDN